MKKVLIFGLTLLLLGSALFAEDAKVMPMRMGRIYLAPSFAFGSKIFDDGGSRTDVGAPEIMALNLGAALEFGAYNWITAAVQWAPGFNVWSDVEPPMPLPINFPPSPLNPSDFSTSSVRSLDKGDIIIGAKMQILGDAGPLKSDRFRLALGPGIKVPLRGPDYKEQLANAVAGDLVTPANFDYHVFGFGLRTYFDYIINEYFFIGLYNEFLYYPQKKDLAKAGYSEYFILNSLNNMFLGGAVLDGEVSYGYDLTFELEPSFSKMIVPGKVILNAGLPLTYKTTPGKSYEFSAKGVMADAALTQIKSLIEDGEQTHQLTLKPGASLFFIGWKVPFEFKLSYFAPLWGMNSGATHTVSLQIRMYFKI